MSERFFVDSDFSDSSLVLPKSEAHHLAHVLRKEAGEAVTLFNGRGREAAARIETMTGRGIRVRILGVRDLPPQAGPHLILAVAVPKGERWRWLVEKAAELGVCRLIPLSTQRGVVHPRAGKLEQARRWVIASAKQCGASHLMHISPQTAWKEFWRERRGEETVLVAHPGGRSAAAVTAGANRQGRYCLVVGPEGGFTEEEIAAAQDAGAVLVDLGGNRLRVETAAVALSAYLRISLRE